MKTALGLCRHTLTYTFHDLARQAGWTQVVVGAELSAASHRDK